MLEKNMNSLVDTFIEINFDKPEDFNKIRETLTRIGYASKRDKTLYQSCHILHKRGKYYIVHFKELFLLDGKEADLTENDISRRNTIALLLEEWSLLKILNPEKIGSDGKSALSQIKIVPYREKEEWNLVAKYTIGNSY